MSIRVQNRITTFCSFHTEPVEINQTEVRSICLCSSVQCLNFINVTPLLGLLKILFVLK